MEIPCQQCGSPFVRTRQRHTWCSDECRDAALTRRCKRCGQSFRVTHLTSPQECCTIQCGSADSTTKAILAAAAAKRERRGAPVECAWDECPKKHELLPPGRRYHSDGCIQAARRAGVLRRGTGTGQVRLTCVDCGKEIFRWPSELDEKRCGDCGKRAGAESSAIWWRGQERACAVCGASRYLSPSRLKKLGGRPFHCSRDCAKKAGRLGARRRTVVHCTQCGRDRQYRPSALPRSVDQQTKTWVCPQCRQPQTTYATRTCAYDACGKEFRARVNRTRREIRRCCSLEHRRAYDAARRRTVTCQHCGKTGTGRPGSGYCSRACRNKGTHAGRRYRTSTAQKLVIAQIDAGITGVAALARAAGVSEPTVRKVLAERNILNEAARIVASAPVASVAAPA